MDLLVSIAELLVREDGSRKPEVIAQALGANLAEVAQACEQLVASGFLVEHSGKYEFNYKHKDVVPLVQYAKKSGSRQELQAMVLELVTSMTSPLRSMTVSFTAPPAPPPPQAMPPPPAQAIPKEEPAEQEDEELPVNPTEPEESQEEETPEEEPEEEKEEAPAEEAEEPEPAPQVEMPEPPKAAPPPPPPEKKKKRHDDSAKHALGLALEAHKMQGELDEFKRQHPKLDPDAAANVLGHLRPKVKRCLEKFDRPTAESLIKEFTTAKDLYINDEKYGSPEKAAEILARMSDRQVQQLLTAISGQLNG